MPLGRRTNLKMSQRAEKQTAKEIGGRRQPGSGNTVWAKGDVKSKDLLVERKDTRAGSYSLKLDELTRIRDQALREDRKPVFVVGFEGRGEFAVIPWSEYLAMRNQ